MLGCTKTQAVKEQAASSKDFALALSRDRKFRKQLLSAIGHGAKAKRRAAKRVGFLAAATRLANDKQLNRELHTMTTNLQHAWSRVKQKQKHTNNIRQTILLP